jgi:hypothetical protein
MRADTMLLQTPAQLARTCRRAWTTFRQLTWGQRWTMVLAVVLLPLFAVLLRCISLARVVSRMQGRGTSRPGAVADAVAAGRAVNFVAFRLRATCLTRSVALQWILSQRGIATGLRVGVRNEGHRLHAHAWVECEGVPVNDTVDGLQGFALVDLP